jgi:hypothetical protein
MSTIHDIHTKFSNLNAFTKAHLNDIKASDFQGKWNELFGIPMDQSTSESFVKYYREMYRGKSHKAKRGGSRRRSTRMNRKNQRKTYRKSGRRGGSLTGAPLNYAMAPGANVSVYGRFPTEISTDPTALKDLDVFYNSALSRGCGTENSTRQVPVNMGSNKVGGRRRKTQRRRKHGGSLLDSAMMRPYLASPYPNPVQSAYESWSGNPASVPTASYPVNHTWEYKSHGIEGIINPGMISSIKNDLTKLASPAPWQTTQ